MDVASRAVATDEEQEVDAQRGQVSRRLASVGGGSLALRHAAEHHGVEASFACLLLPHLERVGVELELPLQRGYLPERLDRPARRRGLGPKLQRPCHGVDAIAALQANPAADPRERVDDQAELLR